MATTTITNDERTLLAELGQALETLGRNAGVKGRVVAIEPKARMDDGPDAQIDIYVAGKKHRYVVEARAHVDRLAAVGQVKAQFDRWGKPGLLFAPYITATMAKQCRQLNLPFLDIAGNAYFHERGLHVYITGEKPEGLAATNMGARGGGTATALRVVFALLCRPELLNAPYRDIVEAANAALGAIGPVFDDLEGRGLIAGHQKHRRFLEPMRVFEEWVTNYPIKLRPKLNPRRFRADNLGWWKQADLIGLKAYWGGEIAAQRLTRYLKPATCTVYIKPDQVTNLVVANRLRADREGDIEVLDTFWNLPPAANHPDVVPPILAYADLIATLDPRNLEVAKLIRNQFIHDVLPQN